MKTYAVKVFPESQKLPKTEQLAWRLAELATSGSEVKSAAKEEVINRIIDNAGVAAASLTRSAPSTARAQALCHQNKRGSSVFGVSTRVSPEWAAWANGTAVRELDYHDTFLAADYSHPADNIPPILAVAEHCKIDGKKLLKAIACAYEVHISLVKAICLHKHKKDHIAHLAPAAVCGIGCLLGLNQDTIYQAVNQAVHCSFSTRQSRKGEISSWKAFAPAWAGKIAIEAVDRAMRGEKSPSPIYEGEDSVIAYMLDPDAVYHVPLPEPGEEWSQILESYTKEHSAEYQAQALIDLAFKVKEKISSTADIKSVKLKTSHHTHYVIGTGSNDPQKQDPNASRETLDHSITYILAVALEDGTWHHVNSYTPERAKKPETVELWHKITTEEDPRWTKAYHDPNPDKRCFGGELIIEMKDGTKISDELGRANAHPAGAKPFRRDDYIKKFTTLVSDSISTESAVGFLENVQRLEELKSEEIEHLNIISTLNLETKKKGLFDA